MHLSLQFIQYHFDERERERFPVFEKFFKRGGEKAGGRFHCPRRAPVRRGQPKERAFAKDFVRKTVFPGKKLAKQFGM